CELDLRSKDAVGIDGVAGMNEKIRAMRVHGCKTHHAAIVRIDAPALARDVAAPHEADVTTIGGRGAETAGHHLARYVGMREIAEFDAVENVLPCGKVLEQNLGLKIISGKAANWGSARASLKDSVVETSTSICEGRSARAHTTPPSVATSPDCTP